MTAITDSYGRAVSVAVNQSGEDVYSVTGISIAFQTGTLQALALAAIEGMAPASYAPPPPAPTMTFLQFMALFSLTEQAAIVNSTDTQVRLFTLMASGARAIILNNPELITGVNYLVTAGVLTSANAALILSGQPSA